MGNKQGLPHGEFIIILIGLVITILLLVAISSLMSVGCGKFQKGLIVESFEDGGGDGDYTEKLKKRLQILDKKIESDNALIESFTEELNNFNPEVCYITKQIDDSLQSNYASNVPESEYKLAPEIQKERNEARKIKSKKYIANLKDDFVKSKNGESMLECFENDGLNSHIDETTNNLKNLNDKFINVQKTVSDKQLGVYYITLAYNDKYIKQSVKVANVLNEGFDSEVIDFSKMSSETTSEKVGTSPITQIEFLEDDYEKLSNSIKLLAKKIKLIRNTINLQQKTLKKSTAITTDEKLQKDQAAANFEKQQNKTS